MKSYRQSGTMPGYVAAMGPARPTFHTRGSGKMSAGAGRAKKTQVHISTITPNVIWYKTPKQNYHMLVCHHLNIMTTITLPKLEINRESVWHVLE